MQLKRASRPPISYPLSPPANAHPSVSLSNQTMSTFNESFNATLVELLGGRVLVPASDFTVHVATGDHFTIGSLLPRNRLSTKRRSSNNCKTLGFGHLGYMAQDLNITIVEGSALKPAWDKWFTCMKPSQNDTCIMSKRS